MNLEKSSARAPYRAEEALSAPDAGIGFDGPAAYPVDHARTSSSERVPDDVPDHHAGSGCGNRPPDRYLATPRKDSGGQQYRHHWYEEHFLCDKSSQPDQGNNQSTTPLLSSSTNDRPSSA